MIKHIVLYFCLIFITVDCEHLKDELVLAKDLNTYATAIDDTLTFLLSSLYENDDFDHIPYIGKLGMSLIFINIDFCLTFKKKLPVIVQIKLESIVAKASQLINIYKKQLETVSISDKEFLTIMDYEKEWQNNLQSFVDQQQFRISKSNILDDVSFDAFSFSATASPKGGELYAPCFSELANNKLQANSNTSSRCDLDLRCLKLIANNKMTFGFPLAIKLHFYMYMRYSRRCHVFSPKRDKEIVVNLCTLAYSEIIYLVNHDYTFFELLLEKIILCSMLGHAQFLNRNWISTTLNLRSLEGCYYEPLSLRRASEEPRERCSGSVSALAGATISLAVRYTIENNLPMTGELLNYIHSIDDTLRYLSSNDAKIDLDVMIGVFIIKLTFQQLRSKLTTDDVVMSKIIDISKRSNTLLDELLKYGNGRLALFTPFFYNVTPWMNNYEELVEEKKLHHLQVEVNNPYYDKNIEAHICFSQLANLRPHKGEYPKMCRVAKFCANMVASNGSTTFMFKQRILFLILAKHARNCFLISPSMDVEIEKSLCSVGYNRVLRIVENKMVPFDALLEQMLFCSYIGYTEFLKRAWLSAILLRQEMNGCFYEKAFKLSGDSMSVVTQKTVVRALDALPKCNSLITHFASTVLSIAIRFLLEMYF